MKSLLYIDMAYSAAAMRRRQQGFWQVRHSGGYFDKVFGFHPVADLVDPELERATVSRLSSRQVSIEGLAFTKRLPRLLAPLDFVLSQTGLFVALFRHFKRRPVSAIYVTDAVYGGLFSYALSRLLRRPLVIAVYANWDNLYAVSRQLAMPRLIPSKRLQDMLIGFLLKRADWVVVGNRNNLDYVLAHGARRDRSSVISTGKFLFDDHFSNPEARRRDVSALVELGLPTDRPLVIYVGRLVHEKLPDQALQAIIEVVERDPSVVGVLAGEGPMRPQLEQAIAARGLAGRIHLPGAISQSQLAALLPHTIVVSPLTGMSLIEAGLAGAPIVAYDLEWQGEFIRNGENGFLVPAGDSATMAERVSQLVKDRPLQARFASAVRGDAMALADRDKIFAAEAAIYDAVIAAR